MNERQLQTIIDTDHQLEGASESAGLALAKHRWHWTKDLSNPQLFQSERAYALEIGRPHMTVNRYVKAYEMYLDKSVTGPINSFAECFERVLVNQENHEAIEAIAEVHGIEFGSARKYHRDQVKQVRKIQETYIEEHPEATPEERQAEVRRAAQHIVGMENARKRMKDPAVKMPMALVSVIIVADLRDALAKIRDAAHEAGRLNMDDEDERDMAESIEKAMAAIAEAIEQVKRIMRGEEKLDWDAGLADLGKGAK